MAPATDPYRALGLEPGATPAEIKRAYRRLAKAYHPDSAGERALPRFLAIQAAYERLTAGQPGTGGSTTRDPSGRRGSRPAPPPPPASRPWSADAERARATRDAFRQRSTRTGARPGPAGTSGGASGTAGASGSPPGTSGTGTSGAAGGRTGGGRGSGRRGRPKATIGSTSYDGTENEPFEPGWSGATWYGAASGTYWTINPKEYADPRKHGPEYLARARRNPKAAAGAGPDPTGDPAAAARPANEGAPSRRERAQHPSDEAMPKGAPAGTPPQGGTNRASDASEDMPATPSPSRPERPERPLRPARPPATRPFDAPGDRPARTGSTSVGSAPAASAEAALHRFGALQPARIVTSWRGRILLAALAWFPLGLAIFGVHGQLTGCSQFLATCTDAVAWSVWIPQVVVFALLLASPRLAWIGASGSILLLALTIPLAAVLTAGSGGRPPSTATTELLYSAMAVGWLAGVAIALSGRIPLPPWRVARVR